MGQSGANSFLQKVTVLTELGTTKGTEHATVYTKCTKTANLFLQNVTVLS